ncbi:MULTISPECIES: hypothetical protein [unclassified Avibacterium]|uniref:hypothetical protein n=1 Tax=unclassified Avibacterium TaxID=2685287 RepID=UPI003FA350BB
MFGKYISIYDIQCVLDDRATVPIFYELCEIRLNESDNFGQVVEEAQTILDDDEKSFR